MGVEKDIERVLISAEELEAHVAEIGAQISRDFEGKDPIFIGVLKGCFICPSPASLTLWPSPPTAAPPPPAR